MKKLVLTILTFLTCGAAYALPVGNPSEASLFLNGAWWDSYCCDPCDPCFSWCDAWSFRAGYYGDFVFDRHLAVDQDSNDSGRGSNIDHTEIFTHSGLLVFNICDRIDIFGTLGASTINVKTDAVTFSPISTESELFFRSDFSWSVGGRATLWNCDCFYVGIEGQYFQTNPDFDNIVRYDTGAITYFNDNNGVCYQEWQVGLGAAYRFATSCPTIAMVPYAAVKWSGCRLDFNDFTVGIPGVGGVIDPFVFRKLRNDKSWGYAIGMTLTLCDMVGVTVEGRWADEKALYVNGQFRF